MAAMVDCIQEGDAVNLESFPTPLWHTGDGGRYIGTADNVIVGEPDEGWINVGVYRGMVQSRNRISLWINPMKHGRILVERHWSKGQAAPVAVVLGCEPVTWMSGSMSPPLGISEYDVAGAYRRRSSRNRLFAVNGFARACRSRSCSGRIHSADNRRDRLRRTLRRMAWLLHPSRAGNSRAHP